MVRASGIRPTATPKAADQRGARQPPRPAQRVERQHRDGGRRDGEDEVAGQRHEARARRAASGPRRRPRSDRRRCREGRRRGDRHDGEREDHAEGDGTVVPAAELAPGTSSPWSAAPGCSGRRSTPAIPRPRLAPSRRRSSSEMPRYPASSMFRGWPLRWWTSHTTFAAYPGGRGDGHRDDAGAASGGGGRRQAPSTSSRQVSEGVRARAAHRSRPLRHAANRRPARVRLRRVDTRACPGHPEISAALRRFLDEAPVAREPHVPVPARGGRVDGLRLPGRSRRRRRGRAVPRAVRRPGLPDLRLGRQPVRPRGAARHRRVGRVDPAPGLPRSTPW